MPPPPFLPSPPPPPPPSSDPWDQIDWAALCEEEQQPVEAEDGLDHSNKNFLNKYALNGGDDE